MTIAAAAPASTPSSPGSASGLRVSACMSAPASPSATPTARPTSSPRHPHVAHHRRGVGPVVVQERADDLAGRDALGPDGEADQPDEREDDDSDHEGTH